MDYVNLEKLDQIRQAKYLVISGGAGRGISFCGALEGMLEMMFLYRHHHTQFSHLRGAAGTSIGSILALACLLNLPFSILRQRFTDPKLWEFVEVMKSVEWNIHKLNQQKAFVSNEFLYRNIDVCLQDMGISKETTFAQFFEKTGKTFICNACCQEEYTTLYMSHETTPLLTLREALLMSMSYPILFPPVLYEKKYYVDGGLFENTLFNVFPYQETIFITNGTFDKHLDISKNLLGHISNLMSSMSIKIEHLQRKALSPEHQEKIIPVFSPSKNQYSFIVQAQDIPVFYQHGKISLYWYLAKGILLGSCMCDIVLFYKHLTKFSEEQEQVEKEKVSTVIVEQEKSLTCSCSEEEQVKEKK